MRTRSKVFLPLLVIAGLALGLAAAGRGQSVHSPASSGFDPSPAIRARAKVLLGSLDLGQEAAQVLLVGVGGKGQPSVASLGLLSSLPVGGVILFGFNLTDKAAELGPFTAALQDAQARNGTGIPLFVAIDHEGGSVFRFRSNDITRLPPPLELGLRGPAYAREIARSAAEELLALGVNLVLAPVVEVLGPSNAKFLGNRSFGRDPARVDAVAAAFIEGLQSSGLAAVAKHFPGNAGADPHAELPVLRVDRASFDADYLPRFASAIRHGVGAVMLSHVMLPAIDNRRPATLSAAIVAGELKTRLDFAGVALTDDLYMKALSSREAPERTAVEALAAGADLLMLSVGDGAPRIRDAILRAVKSGALPRERLDDAVLRCLMLKLSFGMEAGLDPAIRAGRLASFPDLVSSHRRLPAQARD